MTEPMASPFRSPSGLLTRAAWQSEVECSHEQMPRWYASAAERDRQFVLWVHSEAQYLAGQLERLVGPSTPAALARHVRAIVAALAEDAAWAQRRIEGGLTQTQQPASGREQVA